ncbi:MAG: restriction endonuclease subunit S [Microcystaceae cyanobacterium]
MPEGWEVKKLGEVINLEYGKPLSNESRNISGKYPAYGANGIKCWSDEYYFDKPSIIVGRKGSAGEVNLTTEKFWPLDVTYFVTYDDTQYDLIFLYHCLKHLQLTKLAKGVKPGVNRNDVYQIKFLFPTLDEQKRIVAILDEAFEGIDQAIRNTEKNLTNARELFESYLNKIFTQKGDGWVDSMIENHIKFIDYRGRTPNKTQEGMRLITAKNVKMGFLQKEPQEFVNPNIYDEWMTRGIPKKGDVLFTTEAPLGNVAQLDTDEKLVFAQRIIIMQPDSKLIDSTFLKFLLLSNVVQQKIHEKGTGATAQGIKASLLKKILISFPSNLKSQENIVLSLEALEKNTQCLETIYRQKLTALNELKQSILQKAFTGQLTSKKG